MKTEELREHVCDMLDGKWKSVLEVVDEMRVRCDEDVTIARMYALLAYLEDGGVVRSRDRTLTKEELNARGGNRQSEFTLVNRGGTRELSVADIPGGFVLA